MLAVERLIVTDREAIAGTLAGLGRALESADAERALACFAPGFTAGPVDRDLLADVLREACRNHAPSRVSVDACDTAVDGERARSVVAWSVVAGGSGADPRVPGLLHTVLEWERAPDGWRIRGIGTEPGRPYPTFESFGHLIPLSPDSWLAKARKRTGGF